MRSDGGAFVAKGRALSAVHEYPRVSERCYHTHLVNERIFNYISPTYSLKLIMGDRAPDQHTELSGSLLLGGGVLTYFRPSRAQ